MKPGSNDDAYMNDESDEEDDRPPQLLARSVRMPFVVSRNLTGELHPCSPL